MTIRPFAAALLALAALSLAACGEETPSTAGSAESKEEARQAELKFASCMREEGIDMPDPTADGERKLRIGGESGISPEEFERAAEACEKYRKDIRPELSDEQKQELKESALAHARCMREQGIDMPDPTFSEDGGAMITMRAGRGKPQPEDPEFQAAQEECGHLMERPDGEEQP